MKDICGYEGLYAITMTGRVWSYRRKKFLKQEADKDGYLMVILYKDGGRKGLKVHRLVAETYIPNPDNQPQVGHIDENPRNNCWDNLYWTNAKNNCNYGNRNEKISKALKAYNKKIFEEEA